MPVFTSPHTALLVMDLQADILPRLGDKVAPLLARTASVIAAARTAKCPVVYVTVGFRPGYPELDPKSERFAMMSKTGGFTAAPGTDIAPEVRPQHGEVVVIKHRVNAFAGTDLDVVLRAKHIDTLVLCGVATSGVVLSTVRHAADADFKLVVVKDCCADADDEVHTVLVNKVFPRQASVISSSEV